MLFEIVGNKERVQSSPVAVEARVDLSPKFLISLANLLVYLMVAGKLIILWMPVKNLKFLLVQFQALSHLVPIHSVVDYWFWVA